LGLGVRVGVRLAFSVKVRVRGRLGLKVNLRLGDLRLRHGCTTWLGVGLRIKVGVKVPCSYSLTAMGKFALLRYLRKF